MPFRVPFRIAFVEMHHLTVQDLCLHTLPEKTQAYTGATPDPIAGFGPAVAGCGVFFGR